MQLDLSEHVARELAAILHVSTYHIASQETTKKKKKKRRLSIKVNIPNDLFQFPSFLEKGEKDSIEKMGKMREKEQNGRQMIDQ